MAGGTWQKQDKVLPGVYVNFTSEKTLGLSIGSRGVVAICEPMSWGKVGEIVTIELGDDTTPFCGYPIYAPQAKFLKEIFRGSNRTDAPTKVLLYRPDASGSVAATVTTGALTITALYKGVRGNDVTIVITEQVDAEGTFDVETVIDGVIVDTQTAKNAEELKPNKWVKFSGSGALAETAGTKLQSGADGTVQVGAYTTFLKAIEPYDFDIIIYDGKDETVKTAMTNFVERLANTQGKYSQLVAQGITTPDSRFVINVDPKITGIVLSDGTKLTDGQICWWVGGAEAGAAYNKSLTYARYPQAVEVLPAATIDEMKTAVKSGYLTLFSQDRETQVLQDINSLVTYNDDITEPYHKNRVIRTLHTIANDIYRQFSKDFIGVVDNNENGRMLFKSVICGYMLDLQTNNAIQNFLPDDVEVLAGNDIDSIVINIWVQPVDAVEKIYTTISVS